MPETIPIAADHAGYHMKERLKSELEGMGFAVEDLGTHSPDATDYPGYAHEVATKVARGDAGRGVLLCGSGLGMGIAANRHAGVRAVVVWSPETARLSREHNDANVLVLPSRFLSDEDSVEILRTWLGTAFEGGRHARRVAQIDGGSR